MRPASAGALVSVYDEAAFPAEAFRAELDAVHRATQIERDWIAEARLAPYETDEQILAEAAEGRLVRVEAGAGFTAIRRLREWDMDRSDPEHPDHYSPPFLRPHAAEVLGDIAAKWQAEMGTGRSLAVTSLVRSVPYQRRLAASPRKLTIAVDEADMLSSHQVGNALDIDACGLYETDDDGRTHSINPRVPGFRPGLVEESRAVLRALFAERSPEGFNVVEELPGTQQHVFHIAVRAPQLT